MTEVVAAGYRNRKQSQNVSWSNIVSTNTFYFVFVCLYVCVCLTCFVNLKRGFFVSFFSFTVNLLLLLQAS